MLLLSVLAGLTAGLTLGAAVLAQGQSLSGSLVRLHVIAASDSQEDQQVKLQVRDAVLAALPEALPDESAEQAVEELRGALPALAQAAQTALQAAGRQEPVTVRLCAEEYPARDYGSFALPAGEYVSLQVRIGAAEGQNWWCVVYPSLCTAASSEELEAAAEAAGFSDGQLRFMTVDSKSVRFRFKLLEWFQKLHVYFS